MVPPKRFASMHSHTGFSVLDALDPPEEHIDFVRENGMDAWCLTEHGHMNSFAQAYLYVQKINAKGANFKFVPGCEVYHHPDLQQWNLHMALKRATKAEDIDAQKTIIQQLSQFSLPVAPIPDLEQLLTEDAKARADDIQDDGRDATATVENESGSKRTGRYSDPTRRRHHMVVLPRTSRGLKSLFGLVSRGYIEGFYRFPRIDYKMLKEASGVKQGRNDLIATTACVAGPAAYAVYEATGVENFDDFTPELLNDPIVMDKAIRGVANCWDQLTDAVGDECAFLELQFNRLGAQHLANLAVLRFAERNGLMDRLIVAVDSHYPTPERWRDREVYKGLGYSSWKNIGPDSLPLNKEDLKCELYPKNAQQIWDEYLLDKESNSFYGEFDEQIRDAIERTDDIVKDFIEDIHPDRSVKLPVSGLPKNKTPREVLVEKVQEGFLKRGIGADPVYLDRAKHELRIIADKNFELYFLTEQRIMQVGKEHMLCGPGRGSAAGSLICYLLEITDVDPIQWNLSFERFLSPSRTDLPDVDSDFQDRDKMIEILQGEFGEMNVIPISTYGRMQISSSTKDVARLLEIPFDRVNAATKGLDFNVKTRVAGKGEAKAGVDVTFDLAYEYHPPFKELMDEYPDLATMVGSLGKQIKSIGRHAGGVLISEDIPDNMPVIMSRGRLQTPWIEGQAAKQLEPLGWVKFDILGLETLVIIAKTIESILKKEAGDPTYRPPFSEVRKWHDEHLNPKTMNLEDQRVYENVYHEGRWFGIFQCTQSGAQRFFQKARPRNIIEIATLTSIYRPGPLGANVDKMYVEYRDDPSAIPDMHPLVWQVLKPTFGLLVFQEQVMELCHIVANFPLEEVDDVRRAISKGKSEALAEIKERFVKGAMKNDMSRRDAEELFEHIRYFSAYGFNSSHAVSYSLLSYTCAWLLTYYEDEWIAAWCESMSGTNEDRALANQTVKQWGGIIMPIDARYASESWQILGKGKYMPSLSTVKAVGATALEELMGAQPFNSMEELLYDENGKYKLSKLNRRALENLIKVGAFNCFIGEDKEFASSSHMLSVVVEGNAAIKKSLKRTPTIGRDTFREYLADPERRALDERTRHEMIFDQEAITGMVTPDLLVSPKMREQLADRGVGALDEVYPHEKQMVWFVVDECTVRKTRTGKDYLLFSVFDSFMNKHKVFCWGFKGSPEDVPEKWALVATEVTNDPEFGYKTFWGRNMLLFNYGTMNFDKIA